MIASLKIVFASILFLSGIAAAGSMLLLTGRAVPARKPDLLRRIHTWAGWTFAASLLINTSLGFILLARAGDTLPLRVVLHWHLALILGLLVLAKLGFVKVFRSMLRWVPALGLFAAGTALVVACGSLGFEILAGFRSSSGGVRSEDAAASETTIGREMFDGLCAGCHAVRPGAARGGPDLSGLFKRTTLPASGRPATEENVRLQLRQPFRSMPAFPALSEPEIEALLARLRGL
ncbi:MAG: cytochrome c [Acidobacteriota bacterium]|nr:cytochrome c [Acidobacteriota bacterium]